MIGGELVRLEDVEAGTEPPGPQLAEEGLLVHDVAPYSDLGWEPVVVADGVAPDVILRGSERAWLRASWNAAAHHRGDATRTTEEQGYEAGRTIANKLRLADSLAKYPTPPNTVSLLTAMYYGGIEAGKAGAYIDGHERVDVAVTTLSNNLEELVELVASRSDRQHAAFDQRRSRRPRHRRVMLIRASSIGSSGTRGIPEAEGPAPDVSPR